MIYVSATPGPHELTKTAGAVVEQIIRPMGLVDPNVEIRPVKGQVDDLLGEIRKRTANNQRVLVTTFDRIRILRDLRRGEFDVLVGITLANAPSETAPYRTPGMPRWLPACPSPPPPRRRGRPPGPDRSHGPPS